MLLIKQAVLDSFYSSHLPAEVKSHRLYQLPYFLHDCYCEYLKKIPETCKHLQLGNAGLRQLSLGNSLLSLIK